jgi:hypothetical protein
MRTRRARIIAVGAAVAVVPLTVGLGSGGASTPTHATYVRLYKAAIVGKTRITVVNLWPKPPYQNYHDGTGNHCFEWLEKNRSAGYGILYDLCFSKKGVLVSKQKP